MVYIYGTFARLASRPLSYIAAHSARVHININGLQAGSLDSSLARDQHEVESYPS